LVAEELGAHRIGFKVMSTMGTPRRMMLLVKGVSDRQDDLVTQKIGPATKIAYDNDGQPTKAAIGFARGQGIDASQLKMIKTDKGEYICAEKKEKGGGTIDILSQSIPRIINAIPFPKSMRWHTFELRFARPIHWILALFGGEVIPFTLENIHSDNITYGHRFMAPELIKITDSASYLEKLRQAHVMINPQDRRKTILREIKKLAASVEGVPDEDPKLLDEVVFLLEAPFPVLCEFNPEFLKLPRAVLITTMKKHQKYFPVLDRDGNPLAYFIAINNTRASDEKVVCRGHERVLRARLSDAQFFYTEDRKKSLENMVEQLKGVVFQAKLGTSYEKVKRFKDLALFLAGAIRAASLKPKIERAALLCKADLVSEVVGEFPELQGLMGREYARLSGEDEGVAVAIYEHYLPRFAEDDLPSSDIGAIISIADKLDTIVGCFGIDLLPTGTTDPYALRRQCLGIINIILHKNYSISLRETVKKSLHLLKEKISRSADDVHQEVLNFFETRISNLLVSQGYSFDVVDAVLSLGLDDIGEMVERVKALQQMKKEPDFEPLAVAFKRVVNILSKAAPNRVNPDLFEKSEESALYQKYLSIHQQVEILMNKKEYLMALKLISTLRQTVDDFFDSVMVMVENSEIRDNRLGLLFSISSLFTNFADFTKIAD
jgi:glycyl-tRNA synthetase beta chain